MFGPLLLAATLVLGAFAPVPDAHAQLAPGTILVVDAGVRVLFAVHPVTGQRVVLSNFADLASGPVGGNPFAVALAPSGSVLVLDPSAGTFGLPVLFSVDSTTGIRTVLSDFGDPTLGPGSLYAQGVVATNGILVSDGGTLFTTVPPTFADGALLRVDPTTGSRSSLSDFDDTAQGPFGSPVGATLAPSGQILAVGRAWFTGTFLSRGALFSVDPVTGARTVVSDFGDAAQGPLGEQPHAVAVGPSGNILVGDSGESSHTMRLFSVDPATGSRSVLSDFGDAAQGPVEAEHLDFTGHVALGASGEILVTHSGAGTFQFLPDPESGFVRVAGGALFKVDPATGVRTILSDFGDPAQGPTGNMPRGLAVVPASGNTPAGPDVTVVLNSETTVTFSSVSTAGNTTVTTSAAGPPLPASFTLGASSAFYDIQTTATFSGGVAVCIVYDPTAFAVPDVLSLLHYENGGWVDVTISNTASTICGQVTSLSPFVLAQRRALSSLGSASVWVGLKNSDDVGIRFDILAEVRKDGAVVGSGQLTSAVGGSSGFNNAKLDGISLSLPTPVALPQESSLSLTLYVRNACTGSGKNSGTARLWFNDGVANSRFVATIGGVTQTFYLRQSFSLSSAPGPGPKNTIDVAAGSKCSAFKPFGTWTIVP